MSKITYCIFVFLICFASFTYANVAQKNTNKTDSCFADLPKEYKKLKNTIRKIEKSAQDNYLYILPVYNANYQIDTTDNTWETLSSIVKRAAAEINYAQTKDSIYCPNIAEMYRLKGIALFYQKRYDLAYEAFDVAISHLPDTASQVESYIWLIRTLIHLQEYEDIADILMEIEKQIDTNQKDINVYFHNIAAEYYMQMKEYKNALEHLTKSINIGSSLNTRLSFIAAQTAEQLKYYNTALPCYTGVSKKIFINKLMKSYATIHVHLCGKNIEKQRMDSIAEQQRKESILAPEDFEPTIVESYHDSSFFGKSYPYYFNDYAAMFFLDESASDDEDYEYNDEEDYEYYDEVDDESFLSDEMLESIFDDWESISIHIPKTDFTNMQDTIYLPLINPSTEYQLPHFGAVVSRFGWRRYRYHYGTDLKGTTGDSVYCVFDGIVRIAVRNKTYGNVIIVRHYNGLETFYAHCSKLLVSPNQEIKAGELIGLIGNTGRSRGAHLHFESRYKGAAFNPEYMIDFENKKLKSDTLILTKEVFNYKNTYSTSSDVSGTKYHRVKSGETLSSIAKKYRTSVSNIKKMNGLKSDFIREGQRLRIP